VSTKLVPVTELAHTLNISMAQMRVLIEGGYLHIRPNPRGHNKDWSTWMVEGMDPVGQVDLSDKEVRFKLYKRLQSARRPVPVHRMWIALWLMSLDSPYTQLPFEKKVEAEIRRIVKLKEPMRTEQATRLMLKFRDARLLAELVTSGGLEGVKRAYRRNQARLMMDKVYKLAGLDIDGEMILETIKRPTHFRPVNVREAHPLPVRRSSQPVLKISLPAAGLGQRRLEGR
jgi:hypothetical protein